MTPVVAAVIVIVAGRYPRHAELLDALYRLTDEADTTAAPTGAVVYLISQTVRTRSARSKTRSNWRKARASTNCVPACRR